MLVDFASIITELDSLYSLYFLIIFNNILSAHFKWICKCGSLIITLNGIYFAVKLLTSFGRTNSSVDFLSAFIKNVMSGLRRSVGHANRSDSGGGNSFWNVLAMANVAWSSQYLQVKITRCNFKTFNLQYI